MDVRPETQTGSEIAPDSGRTVEASICLPNGLRLTNLSFFEIVAL